MERISKEDQYEYRSMIIDEFENNGTSIRSQCRSSDIAYSKYYAWRKRIKGVKKRLASDSAKVSDKFIEVKDNKKASKQCELTIEFIGGFSIKIEEDFNSSLLLSTLKILRKL